MGNGMKIAIVGVLLAALVAVLVIGAGLENQTVPTEPTTEPVATAAPTEPSTVPSTAPTEPSISQPTFPPENWETDEF